MNRIVPRLLNLIVILTLSACTLSGTLSPKPPRPPTKQPVRPSAPQPDAPALQGTSPGTDTTATLPLVTTADLERVAAGLPTDPGEAALHLAGMIYQGDEATAQAAVGELLRRAGVPIVSTDGPVIGWPNDYVLVDAEVYVDFLPQIARHVREGRFYTPSQVTELLAGIFEAEQALPPEALVGFFATWGKGPDAPLELRWAGAAVRALAARRGQVFYPQANLERVRIDLLQTTLLLAQLTSSDRQRAQVSHAGGLTLTSLRVNSPAGDGFCDILVNGLKPNTPDADLVSGYLQKRLIDDIKDVISTVRDANGNVVLDRQGNPVIDPVRRGAADALLESIKIVSKVLTWYLLITGARIDLEADRKEVHFHHPGDSHSGAHVNFKATAIFESTLTEKQVKCYALAGLDIPPGGPLGKGFLIRWMVDQETQAGPSSLGLPFKEGVGKYVTTFRADSQKLYSCGSCGDRTNEEGVSTFGLYTRTEPEPGGVGVEQEAFVRVIAKIDKEDFPFKMRDFIIESERDALKFPAKKILDLLFSALKRAELPADELTIKVTYHAPSVYLARGQRDVYAGWYDLRMMVDLYTCSGLAGPWQGSSGFQVVPGVLTPIFAMAVPMVFGAEIPPPGYQTMEQQNFMIDPARTNWVPLNSQIQLGGKMMLFEYERDYYKKHGKFPPHDQPSLLTTTISGVIEVYFAGLSFADYEEMGASPFLIEIEEVEADPRCSSGEATFGEE